MAVMQSLKLKKIPNSLSRGIQILKKMQVHEVHVIYSKNKNWFIIFFSDRNGLALSITTSITNNVQYSTYIFTSSVFITLSTIQSFSLP